MYVGGIITESLADGIGFRTVIFSSGCNHYCPGCYNPESHAFTYGKVFDEKMQDEVIEHIRDTPFETGLTLSGGDPMYCAGELTDFVQRARDEIPWLSIWIYSGFTYEEILEDDVMRSLLELCDVLVDGPFVAAERDLTIAFRGSRNQRIIDVKKSMAAGKPVLWNFPEQEDSE